MCKLPRVAIPFLGTVMLLSLMACSDDEEKAVRDLVRDITTQAQEVEQVGRVLQVISTLEQAQGLDSTAQCHAARDIYCGMFQMVRDGCKESVSFCQTVADALYGGSFPAFGMQVCTGVADDRCNELIGHEQKLQRLCIELRGQC